MGNEGVLTPLFHSFTFERIRLASLMLTDGVLAGVFQVRALRFKDRQMNTGQCVSFPVIWLTLWLVGVSAQRVEDSHAQKRRSAGSMPAPVACD